MQTRANRGIKATAAASLGASRGPEGRGAMTRPTLRMCSDAGSR